MTYETIYTLINWGVFPAWLLLLFAPKLKLTTTLVHSGVYAVAYSVLYAAFLVNGMFFGAAADGGGMSTAAAVSTFFSHLNGVLMGWTHYLVFDLFVGSWVARDAVRKEIAHWKIVPCLVFTFILGPVGLLMYLAVRKLSGHAGVDAE